MAKRSGFQFQKPRPKMPKLDLQIYSSQEIMASQLASQQMSVPSFRAPAAARQQPAPESEDMWGDDEDNDFIMLASQVADRVEAHPDVVMSQHPPNNTIDISYGLFQREVDSSTQMGPPIKNTEIIDLMSGDEEDFLNIPMPEKMKSIDKTLQPGPSNEKLKNAQTEAQTKYMQNQMRDQKKEIELLKRNLEQANEKCQQKEGEASSLRYEMNLKEQMADRLRKEKMVEIGALESKYVEKVHRLESAMEALNRENDFKLIDQTIRNRKIARTSGAFTASNASNAVKEVSAVNLTERQKYALCSLRLHWKDNVQLQSRVNMVQLFPLTTASNQTTVQEMSGVNPDLIARFQSLQTFFHNSGFDSTKNANTKLLLQMHQLVAELTKSFKICIDRIKMENVNEASTLVNGKMQSDTTRSHRMGSKQRAQEKKMLYESRVLTAVAAICGQYNEVAKAMMEADSEECDSGNLLGGIIEVLAEIQQSGNHEAYQDLLAASILFLKVLNEQIEPNRQRNHILFKIFRAIVFCRPEIHKFEPLSQYVETVANQESLDGAKRICGDFKCDNFTVYTTHNMRTYTPNTCPLQIYAVQLEMGVREFENTPLKVLDPRLTAIAHIAIRNMNFLRGCLKRPSHWFISLNADGTPNGPNCHCYSYMVVSTISLLYVLIKCWVKDIECLEANLIQTIFKMASIFLHDNMTLHFRRRYLYVGGLQIKNRLQVVYDRLIAYKHVFKLEAAHAWAIKSVNLRRIPQMCEVQSAKTSRANEQTQEDGLKILNDTFASFFTITQPI